MRYFLRDGIFVMRGRFTALVSGRQGDDEVKCVSTVITARLPKTDTIQSQQSFFRSFLSKNGYGTDAVSLAVMTPVDRFRVFAYDGIMVFVHSATVDPEEQPGPVTVIINSREPLPETGLRKLLETAQKARTQAFISAGFPVPDPKTDVIVICCEETEESPNEDERITRAQLLVSETIAYGIPETWNPQENESQRTPPFYIHSSIGGERWTRWNPEGCPYYPCHPSCTNQRCDFCYCPLYPCEDESQGKWLERENGGKIWSCEGCTLVHEPFVADYLTLYPEASVKDLKNIWKN